MFTVVKKDPCFLNDALNMIQRQSVSKHIILGNKNDIRFGQCGERFTGM